ncbi:Acetyltransferase (isoleucine patch superfamily) [Pseudidiomarina planktonica]|uniref:Acetyltransferase (Isoleucine patch superfamily) n=1 Tax=Pseudidiomarina planktonica TaxID=1323738 RepID=A0A1Y6ENJ8_9GAMM|nr:acyltransferase [Pseudidiomarina planktonica]RUO65927.1 acyltransferase [Pseudidiomarina planktonica]SMQ61753.1 Acetyltransferase (isoleucine patch superfamily) [Pseudidiomarina planktonica]
MFTRFKMFVKRLYRSFLKWNALRVVRDRGVNIRINGPCQFSSRTELGVNCHFNGLKVNGKGLVRIGSNFHSGEDCLFITDIHNYKGEKLPYDETYIVKDIIIEENVWIGSRVIILGGVTLGEGAIVQAGSVVVSDVPALSIVGGHPARVFSNRSSEHYFRLKEEGSFH